MYVCVGISDGATTNWPSEHDLFDECEAHSLGSVQSADRSVDNIIQLRSRVSSQDNGEG